MNDLSRPSRIEIDLGAFRHNISVVKHWAGPQSRIMAVVKANAYGHGAVKISEAASAEGADFLGVALLEEARELKCAGIQIPIVILYPETDQRGAEAVRDGFYITITGAEQYEAIKRLVNGSGPIRYFVKVESGMHRYGMMPDEVSETVQTRDKRPDSQMMGITTNIADASMSSRLAEKQVAEFLGVMDSIKRLSQNGLHYSLESSGTLWMNRKADGSLVRVGHLLYGLVPGGASSRELRPVMTVKSRLAEIHQVRAGEGVGYGFTFIAGRDSLIATIPMGYADGYPWSLSNKGHVLVSGKKAPIAGKVCMDAFMVDITDIPGCQVGDEVVILGEMGEMRIDAHELGRLSGSFSYEILSRWSRRLPRIYV